MRTHRLAMTLALSATVACATTQTTPVQPEATFDRAVMPKAAAEKVFAPPPIQRHTLQNGLPVLIAENHELPISGFYLVIRSGSAVDPRGKEGVADAVAEVLTRGTESLDAVAISDAFKGLGTQFGAGASLDASFVTMLTLNKHLDRSLELFSDVVLSPSFPEEELDRVKKETVTSLMQRQDRPEVVASELFDTLLYGEVYHGRQPIGTAESVASLERADLAAYYEKWYHPSNAVLIAAGDLTAETILPRLESALGTWPDAEVKRPAVKTPKAPESLTVYLNDKPGAPQSQIRVGTVGIARSDDRYYSAVMMNEILGGSFQSRINLNLREDKGYTYGARSTFQATVAPGPFLVGTGVRTDATAASLDEIMAEIRGIRGDHPVDEEELTYHQDAIVRRFPSAFESTRDLLGLLATLAVNDLPDDTLTRYVGRMRAQDLAKVADVTSLIDPDHMIAVIVGDRAQVEQPLRDAGYQVVIVDKDGHPVE